MKTTILTLTLALAGAAVSTSSFAQDGYGVSMARHAVAQSAGKSARNQGMRMEQQHAPTGPEIVNQFPFLPSS